MWKYATTTKKLISLHHLWNVLRALVCSTTVPLVSHTILDLTSGVLVATVPMNLTKKEQPVLPRTVKSSIQKIPDFVNNVNQITLCFGIQPSVSRGAQINTDKLTLRCYVPICVLKDNSSMKLTTCARTAQIKSMDVISVRRTVSMEVMSVMSVNPINELLLTRRLVLTVVYINTWTTIQEIVSTALISQALISVEDVPIMTNSTATGLATNVLETYLNLLGVTSVKSSFVDVKELSLLTRLMESIILLVDFAPSKLKIA